MKRIASSLCPTSSSSYVSSSPGKHQVFPSFRGEDIRRSFLSHIIKAFKSKGIDVFIDENDIKRCMTIRRELTDAIRGSRIVIVLFSMNYASSSWCLNELVEIMKCREELGKTVMALFYDVDPTDVKKQTGDFGKAFKKTCKGKTEEEIGRWKHALSKVANIAGYHSSNWENEAAMIEEITTDISNMLNISKPSGDFTGLIGMEAYMEELEALHFAGSEISGTSSSFPRMSKQDLTDELLRLRTKYDPDIPRIVRIGYRINRTKHKILSRVTSKMKRRSCPSS